MGKLCGAFRGDEAGMVRSLRLVGAVWARNRERSLRAVSGALVLERRSYPAAIMTERRDADT